MTAVTDIATRTYNHGWRLDPIVRSLLDTDFYKLLMLQMIWGVYPDVRATFSLFNRTRRVRIADEIDERELRDGAIGAESCGLDLALAVPAVPFPEQDQIGEEDDGHDGRRHAPDQSLFSHHRSGKVAQRGQNR